MLLDAGHPVGEIGDRHGRYLGDVPSADAELQRLAAQPRPAADAARLVDEELLAPLLAALGILVEIAADPLGHAVPRHQTLAAGVGEFRQIDRQRLGIAVEDGVHPLLRNALHRIVEREIVAAPQHLQQREKHVVMVRPEGFDPSGAQRLLRIGNDLAAVEDRLDAQPVASGAGPLGRVERKGVRRRIFERDARGGAHQMPRIVAHRLRIVVVERHRPLALPHRLLERSHQPVARLLAHAQAVDHQVDRVDLVAVELHARRELAHLAVDTGVEVALLHQRLEQLAVVSLAALDDRCEQRDATACEIAQDQVENLLVGVMHHLLARSRRIGARSARIEQTQEVVDLGDGTHRRPRIFVGRLLLDGHHGAQPRDLVHIGTLHRPHELTRVGRQGLHIPPLPLGIDRIECQRRFARPRQAGDNHQLVARNRYVYIFQIVYPCAEYLDCLLSFHLT